MNYLKTINRLTDKLNDRNIEIKTLYADNALLTEKVESLKKRNSEMTTALIMYADESEWTGRPHRLLFNSTYRDGDGFEIARNALTTNRGDSNEQENSQESLRARLQNSRSNRT